MTNWEEITDNVALLHFPWLVLGIDFRRNVTLLRLSDGRLIIHSTAPFDAADIAAIGHFGQPAWLVDATVMHDTFAKVGRRAFPHLPYLAPDGFSKASGVATEPLAPPPNDWINEVEMLAIGGLRQTAEHAFFHRASATLVLGDLLFNFPSETRGWARFFAQKIMGLPRLVGVSRFYRFMIRDKALFAESMRRLLEWDFRRIVVAHGEPILHDAKPILLRALREAGLTIAG